MEISTRSAVCWISYLTLILIYYGIFFLTHITGILPVEFLFSPFADHMSGTFQLITPFDVICIIFAYVANKITDIICGKQKTEKETDKTKDMFK